MKANELQTNFDPTGHLERKVNVRMENGKLVVTKLPGEEQSPSSEALKELTAARLPEIDLTDLLIEVDGWTRFTRYFEHPSGKDSRSPDAQRPHQYVRKVLFQCRRTQKKRLTGAEKAFNRVSVMVV